MSERAISDRLREVLGSSAPDASSEAIGRGVIFVRVDGDGLHALAQLWDGLTPGARPYLKGILPSPSESSRVFLNLVFDVGAGFPLVNVEADFPRDRAAPDFSRSWPHAAWWLQELSLFHGVRFEGESVGGGVTWRLA